MQRNKGTAHNHQAETCAPTSGSYAANSIRPIPKSTEDDTTDESTGTSWGKYTRRSIAASFNKAFAPNDTLVCRNVQGTRADSEKAAYETPPPGTSASRPRVTVKIAMNVSGWMTAHAIPRTACLYLTRTSRSA